MPTPRTPLGAIDGNIQRRQPVTPFTRGYIEKSAVNGEDSRAIGRELNLPESTVRSTLKLNPQRIDGITQPRSGRPRLASQRTIRQILRIVRQFPKTTYKQLKRQLNIDWSTDTLKRILKRKGITNWRAKKNLL
jgi:transposase